VWPSASTWVRDESRSTSTSRTIIIVLFRFLTCFSNLTPDCFTSPEALPEKNLWRLMVRYFYGPDALPVTEQTVSTHRREILHRTIKNISQLSFFVPIYNFVQQRLSNYCREKKKLISSKSWQPWPTGLVSLHMDVSEWP